MRVNGFYHYFPSVTFVVLTGDHVMDVKMNTLIGINERFSFN